jgi:hypothetical protein
MNSRPIIIGDPVSHYFHGEGTVNAIDDNYEVRPEYRLFYQGMSKLKLCRVEWANHSMTWEPEYLLNLIEPNKSMEGGL